MSSSRTFIGSVWVSTSPVHLSEWSARVAKASLALRSLQHVSKLHYPYTWGTSIKNSKTMAATNPWTEFSHQVQTRTTQAPSCKSKTRTTSRGVLIALTLNFNTNPRTNTSKSVQISKLSKEITRILVRTKWWLTRVEAWALVRQSSTAEMRHYKALLSTARCSTKAQAPFTMRKSEWVF